MSTFAEDHEDHTANIELLELVVGIAYDTLQARRDAVAEAVALAASAELDWERYSLQLSQAHAAYRAETRTTP